MPLYRINGLSGAGKSTVGGALKRRGFRVIDADQYRGLSSWIDRDSGRKIPNRLVPKPPRPEGWVSQHAWAWDPVVMDKIWRRSRRRTVFFVGGAANHAHFSALFDGEFALIVDWDVLAERLGRREPERFGVGSVELALVAEWSANFAAERETAGAVLVDGSQPVDQVIDQILLAVTKRGSG